MAEQEPPTVDYADPKIRRPLVLVMTPRGWFFWIPLAALLLVAAAAVAYWVWPERDADVFDGPQKVKVGF